MIPKSFQLLSYTWTVKLHPGPIPYEDTTANGLCDFANKTIVLNADQEPEAIWHAWLHEVAHAVLEAIGRVKLSADEGFVDSLSGALAQVLRPAPRKAPARPRAAGRARPKPGR